MRTVWKFLVPWAGSTEMPLGAEILSVQYQDGNICMWAEVETTMPNIDRHFSIIGTGGEVPGFGAKHIGTVQEGWAVWHVYDHVV